MVTPPGGGFRVGHRDPTMSGFRPAHYEIRVEQHLDGRYADWFEGLSIRTGFLRDRPITVLSGFLSDQSALHGVLNRLQAMGLTLLEVVRLEDMPQ